MNKYNCDKCGFHTNNKTKYQRHLGPKNGDFVVTLW